jgi:hypothetical protein
MSLFFLWPFAAALSKFRPMKCIITLSIIFSSSLYAARPEFYRDLIEYVQPGPDQGETNTCMFVANTGAIELLANKFHDIKNPQPGGTYDLSESDVINASFWENGTGYYDEPVHRFNRGWGIHISEWPYMAWNDTYVNYGVWNMHPNYYNLPHVALPQIESVYLFQYGKKFSTYVLMDKDIEAVKEALWKYKSPVLVNYVDDGFWHNILIVGYDDRIPGDCYDAEGPDCNPNAGAFYIRDSFGVPVELRSTDWFKVKGNAAFVVKLKNSPATL